MVWGGDDVSHRCSVGSRGENGALDTSPVSLIPAKYDFVHRTTKELLERDGGLGSACTRRSEKACSVAYRDRGGCLPHSYVSGVWVK